MDRDTLTDKELSGLYHTLRAKRRRLVIQILGNEPDGFQTTRTLARQITSIEQDIAIEQATGEPYRNVYNSLSQTHLPTLADAKLIIYEPQRQRITTGPNFENALLLLKVDTAALGAIEQVTTLELNENSSSDSITD
jgi:hypothetical protein